MGYKAKKIEGKTNQVHRLVMEKKLGRSLTKKEIVHHIDGDKSNNTISNLKLFPTKSAHTKFHQKKGDINSLSEFNTKHLIDGKLKCNKCGILKYLALFPIDKSRHFGRRGDCTICYNKSRRSV